MAACTESNNLKTEFAGEYKMYITTVNGAVCTVDSTITISGMTVLKAAFAQLKEAPTANCAHVRVEVDGTTTNKLNVQFYEDDHATVCTTGVTDAYIMAIGY